MVRVARRAWLTPELHDDLAARCDVLLETCADDSVISSFTAARLHGLWLPPRPIEPIHIATATPGRRGRLMTRTQRPEVVAHRFQLRPQDIVCVDGLPVSSVARCWRELAMMLELPDLVAAGDSALRLGATPDELRAAVDAGSQRHQVRRARLALSMLDPRSRSRPESHLRVAVTGHGIPKFEVNVAVHRDDGGWLAEPDLSLVPAKLALEYQGADHAALARMRKDITRSADMRSERWETVLYGPAEVFGRPWQIRGEVRLLVKQRAPWLLAPHWRGRTVPG